MELAYRSLEEQLDLQSRPCLKISAVLGPVVMHAFALKIHKKCWGKPNLKHKVVEMNTFPKTKSKYDVHVETILIQFLGLTTPFPDIVDPENRPNN